MKTSFHRIRKACVAICVGCFLWLLPANPTMAGRVGLIGIFSDFAWEFNLSTGPLVTTYVIVYSYVDLKQVRFAAPPPLCLSGATFLSANSPFEAGGSMETMYTVPFGSCQPGWGIHVATINWFVPEPITDYCCLYRVFGDPITQSSWVEAIDCAGEVVFLEGQGGVFNFKWDGQCGSPTVPSIPVPSDGADNVPLDVDLSWDCVPPLGTNIGVFRQTLYFGTAANPPVRIPQSAYVPERVGPLLPNTTYYWKITAGVDFGGVAGPIWSFTTGAPTATKRLTWGAVKALYDSE